MIKIFGQQVRRQIGSNGFRIYSGTGFEDGLPVNVCGKNFDINARLVLLHQFLKNDCQGIGFLAGGATGNPAPYFLVFQIIEKG